MRRRLITPPPLSSRLCLKAREAAPLTSPLQRGITAQPLFDKLHTLQNKVEKTPAAAVLGNAAKQTRSQGDF